MYGTWLPCQRDDVERGVVVARPPRGCRRTSARPRTGRVAVLVRRDRRQEVAGVGEAVGADRAELGQRGRARRSSRRHSRARRPSSSSTRKRTPRGTTRDLAGRDREQPELGAQQQPAALAGRAAARRRRRRSTGRSSSGWRGRGGRRCRCAGATSPLPPSGPQPVDEVGAARRDAAAGPSAAGSGPASTSANGRAAQRAVVDAARTPDALPTGGSGRARSGGSRARGSVNAVPLSCSAYSPSGRALRGVAPDGQGAGDGLAERARCRTRTGSAARPSRSRPLQRVCREGLSPGEHTTPAQHGQGVARVCAPRNSSGDRRARYRPR